MITNTDKITKNIINKILGVFAKPFKFDTEYTNIICDITNIEDGHFEMLDDLASSLEEINPLCSLQCGGFVSDNPAKTLKLCIVRVPTYDVFTVLALIPVPDYFFEKTMQSFDLNNPDDYMDVLRLSYAEFRPGVVLSADELEYMENGLRNNCVPHPYAVWLICFKNTGHVHKAFNFLKERLLEIDPTGTTKLEKHKLNRKTKEHICVVNLDANKVDEFREMVMSSFACLFRFSFADYWWEDFPTERQDIAIKNLANMVRDEYKR